MAPLANIEHQELVSNLIAALRNAFTDHPQIRVFPGVNVSDRQQNWEHNYRCPDVAVVLTDSRAIDCDAFFLGGPDFVAEITSDFDRCREKLEFYARVGVRELLLVDRNPWQLELYRCDADELRLAGVSSLANPETLSSQVLSLTFQLLPRPAGRPQIEVCQPATGQRWIV
jgi:Uma2 family endonuclease